MYIFAFALQWIRSYITDKESNPSGSVTTLHFLSLTLLVSHEAPYWGLYSLVSTPLLLLLLLLPVPFPSSNTQMTSSLTEPCHILTIRFISAALKTAQHTLSIIGSVATALIALNPTKPDFNFLCTRQ